VIITIAITIDFRKKVVMCWAHKEQ